MERPRISITIITLNEERHIFEAIQSVQWADEIIVVDSGSTDQTAQIVSKTKAKFLTNPWIGYGQQKNFAQNQATHDWVLNIDADERITPSLALEIQNKLKQVSSENLDVRGFKLPRKTFYLGRWIKFGGWYPNYLVRLVNRRFAKWTEPAVHEELKVDGKVLQLTEPLSHYAFSSIQEQILTNLRFSQLGSLDLKKAGQQASLSKLILKPIGKFIETYILKKGFLDGLPGFIISVNAAHSMFLKYAYLFEARIKNENPNH